MIVDCHAHLWEAPHQLGRCAEPGRTRIYTAATRPAGPYDLQMANQPADVTFVLGFRARMLNVNIPNAFIAAAVQQQPDRLLGFGAIDPDHDNVRAQADHIRKELRLAGFVVSPTAQGFHPASTTATLLYDYATDNDMPIIVHNGPPFGGVFCEFGSPDLFAGVCREYSKLKLIFSHFCWPWSDSALRLAMEYDNVYINTAGIATQTWHAYQTLVKAYQLGVIDKFLFASGFPDGGAAAAIESLYSLNQLVGATNLPAVPRHKLREIVERNTLTLLGLDKRLPVRHA
jgi:predicted TIM-barrel fold metal-dependent hydrolase